MVAKEKKTYGPNASEKTTNSNVYTNMQNKGAGLLLTKSKPAAKPAAKKRSAGAIVDAKAKGMSIKPEAGTMAKKVEVKKADKKEMSAKQEAKVSRLAQKKEKLRSKGELAAKSGDQTRAKRLRERYDRKTERVKKVSK